ncbi:hypothetical protein ACFL6C_02145 [Myxococcota bacterium]
MTPRHNQGGYNNWIAMSETGEDHQARLASSQKPEITVETDMRASCVAPAATTQKLGAVT